MTQGEDLILETENVIIEGESEVIQEEPAHAITLFAEPVYHYKGFPITNALLTGWVTVLAIVIIALVLKSKLKEIPSRIQSVFEIMIEGALSLCDQVTNSRALSIKIFPIAISVFFFVLINNWLGILQLGGLGIIE